MHALRQDNDELLPAVFVLGQGHDVHVVAVEQDASLNAFELAHGPPGLLSAQSLYVLGKCSAINCETAQAYCWISHWATGAVRSVRKASHPRRFPVARIREYRATGTGQRASSLGTPMARPSS